MTDSEALEAIDRKLGALVALTSRLATTDEKDKQVKLEVLLKNAGLDAVLIAQLLGKTTAAVRKTIERAGK